jgi:hypothetical protein
MSSTHDFNAARRFAKACADARTHLRREMEARGLHERDGWLIVETVRQADGGSELVMRPLHLRLNPPDDLECVVSIDEDSSEVDVDCTP